MMFSKKDSEMVKNQEVESNSINTIGAGTQIIGEINSNGDIRIDGRLKGNLVTKGRLVVGPNGIIEGDINCKNSDISGKVDGKIVITELLSLRASAKIHGDIITSKITIEPGAIFTGTCNMDGNSSNLNAPKIEQREEGKK